jgi:hypothetical protein
MMQSWSWPALASHVAPSFLPHLPQFETRNASNSADVKAPCQSKGDVRVCGRLDRGHSANDVSRLKAAATEDSLPASPRNPGRGGGNTAGPKFTAVGGRPREAEHGGDDHVPRYVSRTTAIAALWGYCSAPTRASCPARPTFISTRSASRRWWRRCSSERSSERWARTA